MSWLTDAQEQNQSFEKGISQKPSIQNLNIDVKEPSQDIKVPETPESWLTTTKQQQITPESDSESLSQKSLKTLLDIYEGGPEVLSNLVWAGLTFELSIGLGMTRMKYEKVRNLVVSKDRERSPKEILGKVKEAHHWMSKMVPPPKTKTAQSILEPIGDMFHWLFTGPRKIGEDMTKFYGPNAGWYSEQVLTLGMCRLAHLGGKKLISKIKEVTKNVKGAKAKKVAEELDEILKDAQKSKNPTEYDRVFQKKVNEFEATLQAEWKVEMDKYLKKSEVNEFAPAEPGYAKSPRPPKLPKIPTSKDIESFREIVQKTPELSLAEKPKVKEVTLDTIKKDKIAPKIKPKLKEPEIELSERVQVEYEVNLDTAKDMGIYETVRDLIEKKKSSKDILTQLKKDEYYAGDLKDFDLSHRDIVSAIQAVRIAEFKDPIAIKHLENSMKKEAKKIKELEKTSIGYHGTSSIFIEGIKKRGLKPISLEQVIENVLDKLKLKGKERDTVREIIKKEDYFEGAVRGEKSHRSFETPHTYVTKEFKDAKDYAEWAGESYDNALIAAGATNKIGSEFNQPVSKIVETRAKKLYEESRAATPVVLEVKFPGELKKGDNITSQELKYKILKEAPQKEILQRVDPLTGRKPGMPKPERKTDLETSDIIEEFKTRQEPLISSKGKVIKTKNIAERIAQEQGLIGTLIQDSSGKGWRVISTKEKKIRPKKEELQELQDTWDKILEEDLKESNKKKSVEDSLEPLETDSWDGLLKLLESEKGAITIDPLDFKRAADFLKSKGMKVKNAIKLLKARGVSDDFIRTYYEKEGRSYIQNLNKEPKKSQWLKAHQRSNQLMEPRNLGKGRKAPAVSRGDAKIIEEASDIGRPLLGEKIRHLATSEGLMTSLGKPIRETFLRRAMKGEKKGSDIQKTLLEESKRLKETLPFWSREKSSERIDNYAMSRQINGEGRLKAMGKEIVKELSPAEMKIYDKMQEVYRDLYVKINKIRKAVGQKEFPAVKNYSTWIHDLSKLNEMENVSMFARLESIQKGLKKIQKIPSKLDISGRTPSMKGHEKFRGDADTPGYLKLDAFENFNQYAMIAGDVLGKTEHLAYLHELLQPKFELYKNAPNTYNFLTEWLDYQKGTVPEMFVTNPKTKRVMAKLSGNVAVSYITYAPRSAIVQFSSLNNSIAEIGLPRMLQGITKGISPTEIKRASRDSNALTVRTPEAIIMDSLTGTPTFPGKTGKRIHKVGKAAKKIGIAPLSLTDSIVSYTTWLGAEAKGRSRFKKSAEYKKLSGKEAKKALDEFGINLADDVVIRAQGSAAKSARAPIQRTAEGKFITTLQTFTIANFDYLTRHILGIKNPDITKPKQLAKAMYWVASSAIISQGFDQAGWRSPIPTPIKEYQEYMEQTNNKVEAIKKASGEILEFIPIYGGKYKFGSELSGAVIDQLVKLGKGDMTALPRLMGTPGFSTLLKGYRAYEKDGTASDILMGRYIEKPKRRRGGGLSGF